MRRGEHIVLALAVAALTANLMVHLDRQVIVDDVDEYWLHGTTRYYQLMTFALSENSATQELLHRRHPESRVVWRVGLVEIVAHAWLMWTSTGCPTTLVIAVVAYRSRQVVFAAQNNSGKECGDGSRLLHLAACGFSQISIGRTLTRVVDTVPPGSAGRGRHS